MRAYEIQFDQNPDVEIEFPKGEDESTIAGLLKLFLRELPEPPIPHALYNSVFQLEKISDQDKNEKIDQIREILHKLPEHNYHLLQCMCCLLRRIVSFSAINMMKETNLAIVFGPVFAYPPSSLNVTKQQFLTQHLSALSSVCELMISHYIHIFHNDRVLDCLLHSNNNIEKFKELCLDSSQVPSYAERDPSIVMNENNNNNNNNTTTTTTTTTNTTNTTNEQNNNLTNNTTTTNENNNNKDENDENEKNNENDDNEKNNNNENKDKKNEEMTTKDN
jgi:hypothetical protein